MSPSFLSLSRVNRKAITAVYRAEARIRNGMSRFASLRGWTPAVIPYVGYSSGTSARVLGRVVLAPPSFDPAERRGVRAWRHLFSLEQPHTDVEITVGRTTVTTTSDDSGIVDARIPLESALPLGTAVAHMDLPRRDPVPAHVHVLSPDPVRGVICDIDDTAWVTGLAHPFRAAWRTLRGTGATRKTVPGMPELVRTAVGTQPNPAVAYVSNGPWNFIGPVSQFLELQKFPGGAVLLTDWGVTPTRWFRDGKAHKANSIARLMDDLPNVTWVLIGDDGEHDPDIYEAAVRDYPGRVLAVVLRRAGLGRNGKDVDSAHGVPVIRGDDGDALLPLLREAVPDGRSLEA